MPRVVWILGCAILVQGTSELMVAGLLPGIAEGVGVSLPRAGLLISGFAVGMLVGAPVLAVLTRRLPRRATLLTFVGVFTASHVVGALAPDYTVLLASRVVGAVVYAGFWAVASAVAIGAVPESARGRAMSVVVGGLTVSTLVGLPAGTALGEALGWRAAFWAVAIASALTALGIAATVPGAGSATAGSESTAGAPTRPLTRELADLATMPLALAWGTIALCTAAVLATYSYLAPIITDGVGLGPAWIPVLLALYGIGSVVGIVLGGRAADRDALATLRWGVTALIAVSVALAATPPGPAVTIPLIVLFGVAAFFTNPALQLRAFTLAGDARDLAAAVSVAAFNVGIALGPWLGGLVLTAEHPTSVSWVGSVAAAAALVLVLVATRVAARARTRPTSTGAGPAGADEPARPTGAPPSR